MRIIIILAVMLLSAPTGDVDVEVFDFAPDTTLILSQEYNCVEGKSWVTYKRIKPLIVHLGLGGC